MDDEGLQGSVEDTRFLMHVEVTVGFHMAACRVVHLRQRWQYRLFVTLNIFTREQRALQRINIQEERYDNTKKQRKECSRPILPRCGLFFFLNAGCPTGNSKT